MREFLATLKATLAEYFNPRQPELDDDERQSVDEATAARTKWIRDSRLTDEEVSRMTKGWDW